MGFVDNSSDAAAKFISIREAWSILQDPVKRNEYDLRGTLLRLPFGLIFYVPNILGDIEKPNIPVLRTAFVADEYQISELLYSGDNHGDKTIRMQPFRKFLNVSVMTY